MLHELKRAAVDRIEREIAEHTENVMRGALDDRKARDLIGEVRGMRRAVELITEEFRKLV